MGRLMEGCIERAVLIENGRIVLPLSSLRTVDVSREGSVAGTDIVLIFAGKYSQGQRGWVNRKLYGAEF